MIDLNEIKKLPVADRLQLIDDLWQTIDDEMPVITEEEESKIIEERMALYEKGALKFYPWEEVKARIQQRLQELR